jgi:hypothetical protein
MTEIDHTEGEDLPNPADREGCRAYFRRRREAGVTNDLSTLGNRFGPSTHNVLGYASPEEKADMDGAMRHTLRRQEREKAEEQ